MMQIFATGADAGRERAHRNLSKSGADSGNRCFYAAGALFPREQRMMQISATGDFTRQERT